MNRKIWLAAIVVLSLLTTGCASLSASGAPEASPRASHTMPDGTLMPGAEHGAHGSHEPVNSGGPSEAAQMICVGQVPGVVADILGVEGGLSVTSTWEEPMFTCTYDFGGEPLTLSVHDATDEAQGAEHFADLKSTFGTAEEIEGLAALGMPSFTTGDGVVAFLRDGKTLLVDARALPSGLGTDGTRTQSEAAYTLATAVLVCWTEHD